jgi:hypothetical protein
MRQRTSDPARQRQARFDRTDHKHPRDARLPPPRARYVGNAIGMSCRPRRRGPRFRPRTRDALLPESDSEGSTDVSSDAQVAITRSIHTCSSCLMVFDLRKSSPRSDSNRRPSDYESVPSLPAGPAQGHRGCSGAGTISSRPVPYRLVVAPGLPQRLPTIRRWRQRTYRACLGWATTSIRLRSDARPPASIIRRASRRLISPGTKMQARPRSRPAA